MNAPKIPSSWNECSMDELNEIHRLSSEYNGQRAVRNLFIWLMLSKMEFAKGEGEISDNGEVTYWLRRKGPSTKTETDDEEFFSVRIDDLSLYINGSHLTDEQRKILGNKALRVERKGVLDWVDEFSGKDGQGGLTQLPTGVVTIGKKDWKLPTALITNITYEQYTNAQQLQHAIWTLTEQLNNEQQRIMDEASASSTAEDVQHRLAELEPTVNELKHYRAQLLSHLIIPAEKGVEYKSEDAEERIDFFLKHMDEQPYLLDILIQHLQSCLGFYKTQFPELFSEDEKGSDYIPMVNEVNTINAIMKWQGYQEQQKVFDSNAIFIFSILNSMTKEAKAIEEANAKMKNHRK